MLFFRGARHDPAQIPRSDGTAACDAQDFADLFVRYLFRCCDDHVLFLFVMDVEIYITFFLTAR
jgi:hypothetical protein